ncbi:MAG: pantoate--beta-alanine ligase [Microthrixaceae bacterium]
MDVLTTIDEVRAATGAARSAGRTVGLVPTMGALHEGHVSLMDAAIGDGCALLVTIFVNPLQFAAGEDLSAYPRPLEDDLAASDAAGATWCFVPADGEMYPTEPLTTVSVARLGDAMEGASRPTHFAGVATVVTKLFAIAGACRAYFGEKDFQQLAIVRQLASDLSMPVEVVGCPIVREPDGLARSSRNVYLTARERAAAPVLHRALSQAAEAVRGGETDPAAVLGAIEALVRAEPLAEFDYAAAVDPATMDPVAVTVPGVRLLAAARFGIPRLLDNVATDLPISPADPSAHGQETAHP